MTKSYTHSDEAAQSTALYEADGKRRSALADGSKPVGLAGIQDVTADESRASADEIESLIGQPVPELLALRDQTPFVTDSKGDADSRAAKVEPRKCDVLAVNESTEPVAFPPSLCTLAGEESYGTVEGHGGRELGQCIRKESVACPPSSEYQASPVRLLTLSSPQGLVLERVKPTEPAILEMVRAHYSHKVNCQKRERTAKTSKNWWGPAKLIVFSDLERTFVFAWQWPKAEYRADKQSGFNNTLFHRTERCPFRASEIILAAEQAAVKEWGENRAYSYIDSKETRETKRRGERIIGFCYLKAGWQFVKIAASGKHLFEKNLVSSPQGESSAEQRALVSALEFESGLSGEANSLAGEIPNSKPAQCESGAGKGSGSGAPELAEARSAPAPEITNFETSVSDVSEHFPSPEHLKICQPCANEIWRAND